MSKHTDLEQKIVELAGKDDAFRAALLKDAKSAIEKKFDVRMPSALKVVAVEDTADTVHLVLPPKISDKDGMVAWV